jgi:hypothetical protein
VIGLVAGSERIEGAPEEVARLAPRCEADDDTFDSQTEQFLSDREGILAASGAWWVGELPRLSGRWWSRVRRQQRRLCQSIEKGLDVAPDAVLTDLESRGQVGNEFIDRRLPIQQLPDQRADTVEPAHFTGSQLVEEGFVVEVH